MSEAEVCEVCKHDKPKEAWLGCSEFCNTATTEDIAFFLTMKPGDFGLWPCSECGCTIEDVYVPGGHCSRCSPKVQLRRCYELLGEVLPQVDEPLAGRIRLLLGRE